MTIDKTRTIRISLGGAVLTLYRPDTLTAGDRESILAAIDGVLTGETIINTATGPEQRRANPGSLRPHWMTLLVDVDGINGYHSHEFTREGLSPFDRLNAMANGRLGPDNPGRDGATRLLHTLGERSAAEMLRGFLLSTISTLDTDEPPARAVGDFVGYGCNGVSQGGHEWIVDPETGCITAAVDAGVPGMIQIVSDTSPAVTFTFNGDDGWELHAEPFAAEVVKTCLQTMFGTLEAPPSLDVGDFVGYGCTGVAHSGHEWVVDPESGCITAVGPS